MKATIYSKNNLSKWGNYYKKPLTFYTFFKRMFCHLEFLYKVIIYSGHKSIEIGMGAGAHSSFLSWFSPCVIGLEYDKSVLSVAKKNIQRFGRHVLLVNADAFNLPFKSNSFDLCFSQGFFEHFEGEKCCELLKEQTSIGKIVIFSVPSDNYPKKDFGNERLLSPKYWLEIINTSINSKILKARVRYSFLDIESLKYSLIKRCKKKPFHMLALISRK
ncbi:class I SAM-dependent methyltransferase [candidate division WOR-3 bacterium]|nr:class I SAM-dependent methyltransferase [candidate division WOR-3 bacterium]